jgi:hypothetical protein
MRQIPDESEWRGEPEFSKLAFHCFRVHYYGAMKNITLSADGRLIEEARNAARMQKTTLNQLFREWLVEISERRERSKLADELLEKLQYANSGGAFTRDEMNDR